MTFGDKDSIFLKTVQTSCPPPAAASPLRGQEHLVPPSVPPPRAGLPSSRARRRPRLSRAPSPTRRGRRREELGPQPPALSALELPLPSFPAPRLPQPGSPRASAWAPRSESLGNGAGSADPGPGKPARVVSSGALGRGTHRFSPIPACRTPLARSPRAGCLNPRRSLPPRCPSPAETPTQPAPSSFPAGAHCSACGRVGAQPLRSRSPLILPPSPGAGHEEPPGAAQRPAGCALTSPAADGDMSSAHRVPRPAASPIRRRPAGQRCPGE
nr:vegetative cell wall protein gp1-like [Chlorocebus sabaeus]